MQLKNEEFLTAIKKESTEDKVVPISKILLRDHQVVCGITEGSEIAGEV